MKRKMIENLSALSIMQLLNYTLPLLTLPFLIRVLGIDSYGAYIFSQALIAYFLIFVDFGFDLYATRQISINRDNKQKIERLISGVFYCKIFILVLSFVMLLLISCFVPIIGEYIYLHIINFVMILGTILFANFYYQGIEEMKYITIWNAASKIVFTICIFIFIRESEDLILVATFNSLGYLIFGIFSLYIILEKHKIKFVRVSLEFIKTLLKESSQFFWSRVAVSIYTTSNTFIIGLVLGNSATGIYGAAEKILRGLVAMYGPLNTVFYPYIARERNVSLFKKVMKYVVIINIFVAISIFLCSDLIIDLLFGTGYDSASFILKLFCISLIYTLPNVLIGYPLLGGMGYTKEVNLSVIYSAIIHLALLMICIPFLSIELVAILVLITEMFVFLIRFYYVKKYKLLADSI